MDKERKQESGEERRGREGKLKGESDGVRESWKQRGRLGEERRHERDGGTKGKQGRKKGKGGERKGGSKRERLTGETWELRRSRKEGRGGERKR